MSSVYLKLGDETGSFNGQACGLLNLSGRKVGDQYNIFENVSFFKIERIKSIDITYLYENYSSRNVRKFCNVVLPKYWKMRVRIRSLIPDFVARPCLHVVAAAASRITHKSPLFYSRAFLIASKYAHSLVLINLLYYSSRYF